MSERASVPERRRTGRTGPVPVVLAVLVAAVVVWLAAYFLLRDDALDLSAGLVGVPVGLEVEGDDLVVIDTVQGEAVLVETSAGALYVRYGEDIADRFGVGTVVDLRGEVAATSELPEDERARVPGDAYVVADELEVDEG